MRIRKSLHLPAGYSRINSPPPQNDGPENQKVSSEERICIHLLTSYLLIMVGKADHAEKVGELHLATLSALASPGMGQQRASGHCWDPVRTTEH